MKPKDASTEVATATDERAQLKPARRPQVILEDDTIRIRVPIRMRHRNNRREVVVTAPEEPPSPQEALVRAVARAHYWQELLDSGELKSIGSLASRFHVDHSYVARTLRLASLSPEIVEMILTGKEPDSLSLRKLAKGFPVKWDEQVAELCG